jgi:hypothetical protein
MQCRAPPLAQVSGVRPAQRPSPSDRDCPLDTAGDRCLWHVGGTAGENNPAITWRSWLPARPQGKGRPRRVAASLPSGRSGAWRVVYLNDACITG